MAAGLPTPHNRSHPSGGFCSPRSLSLPVSLCPLPRALNTGEHGSSALPGEGFLSEHHSPRRHTPQQQVLRPVCSLLLHSVER